MKLNVLLLLCCDLALTQPKSKSVSLENLTWVEAERVLTPQAVVVIALGAQAKEHGPHLRLNNDFVMAEYLKRRIMEQTDVVTAPTINYSFYPAFLEYPGSTSIELDTARDLIVDICRTLANYGPRRFYIANTGVSTLAPLRAAQAILAANGVLMNFADLLKLIGPVESAIKQQQGGTHADEIETSMMLYLAPDRVEMSKAVKDYHEGTGPLTRKQNANGTYSPSGIWGDATLANRAKGQKLVEALVAGMLHDIEALRNASLPSRTLDQLDLSAYAGEYRNSQDERVIVRLDGGRLKLIDGRRELALLPISGSRFTSGSVPVHFLRDASGRVAQVNYSLAGVERVAFRASGQPPR